MPIGIDPRVDYAFKYVFGREQNADLLLDLLNAILDPPPDKRLEGLTILNPFLPGDGEDDKLVILDLLARDTVGRRYNIEMQLFQHRYLKERFLYYWAKAHTNQLVSGEAFEELRTTISVLILNEVMFKDLAGPHQRFRLWDETHQSRFSDQMDVHLLELPKFHESLSELNSPLDAWLYFLQHVAELELEDWPEQLSPPLHRAAKELEMLSLSEIERLKYEARLNGKRDYDSALFGAKQDGIEIGLEQGLERGLLTGKIQTLQELNGLPVMSEAELHDCSLAKLNSLLAELRAKHLNRDTTP